MRTKRYFAGIICWLLLLLFGNPQIGLATEYVSQELPDWQEELDEYDFTQLEKVIRELLPDDGLTFRQITEQLLAGDMTAFCQEMGEYAKQILWGQMVQGRQTAWQVLLLAVAGAVFTNLARAFPDSGVSQSGFYVMYMLLAVLLLSIFSSAVVIAVEALTAMGRLMSAFLPVFFLIVAVQGQLTAAAMYECSLLLLRGIQWLYCRVITSGIRIWVLLRIIEGIFAEDMLTHLTEMLGKGLKMLAKTGFGAAVGFQTIQSLLLPYLDVVKGGMLVRMAGAIPGVGNSIRSVAQMALGTAALIRNSIGMAGVVVLVAVSAGPLIQLCVMGILYHGLAALLQPVSDKRVVGAVAAVGDGCLLLMKVYGLGVLLLGIFIGIACACFGQVG
ncbi:MAG: stage III sporulation protein AE [Lachnospiraceae bacterium]|nr:stage III sporulation protein AE [Lachnospiraceae bacterium]